MYGGVITSAAPSPRVATVAAAATENGYDWVRYDRDIEGTGYNPDPGINVTNAASNGTTGVMWSAPVIADGVLYEGDNNGFMYAYAP
jgi:hypothetical protein